ncbi:MAG: response regulator, partial [Planctomycetes bacterium]|nr:response regulator [Planctomycetota bacterium]
DVKSVSTGVEDNAPARETTPHNLDILVVDDEVILQDLIRSMLSNDKVDAVTSGEKAIALMESKSYDIVFLDLILEGQLDGFEVFEWMHKNRPNTKVVILTGRPEHKKLPDIIGRANGAVYKPFSIMDIENAIAGAYLNMP